MKQNDTTGKGEAWVIVQLVLLAAIAVAPAQLGTLPTWPAALVGASIVAGIVCGLVGLAFVGLSALYLGTSLSIFPRPKDDATLTRSGLYGLVRHPMYAGVILVALGWSLLRTSWLALLFTLILIIFFDRKAAREEIWLAQKFPEYVDYRQHVKKLIPWVY